MAASHNNNSSLNAEWGEKTSAARESFQMPLIHGESTKIARKLLKVLVAPQTEFELTPLWLTTDVQLCSGPQIYGELGGSPSLRRELEPVESVNP